MLVFADGSRAAGASLTAPGAVQPAAAAVVAAARALAPHGGAAKLAHHVDAALVPAAALGGEGEGEGDALAPQRGFARCWGVDERVAGNFLVRRDTFLRTRFDDKKILSQARRGGADPYFFGAPLEEILSQARARHFWGSSVRGLFAPEPV